VVCIIYFKNLASFNNFMSVLFSLKLIKNAIHFIRTIDRLRNRLKEEQNKEIRNLHNKW